MTIPQYDLATRRRLAPAYPPVAAVEDAPARFDQSYVGTKMLRKRFRRALLSYAAGQLSFWQFTIAIVVLGAVAVPVSAQGQPIWFVVTLASIFVVGALVMPLRLALGVRRAADSYAAEGETYSSTFDQSTVFWRTPTNTYAVPWVEIDKAVFKRGVTILTLTGSRAICVLPDELVTSDARSRFAESDRHRRELS